METRPLVIKPMLLESSLDSNEAFFKLSARMQSIFLNDKQDTKMVLPTSGYAGHRRGVNSRNFHGKSEREVTIQSKLLER
jgi:hypothetical protein